MFAVDEFVTAAPDARVAVVAVAVVLGWPSARGLSVGNIADQLGVLAGDVDPFNCPIQDVGRAQFRWRRSLHSAWRRVGRRQARGPSDVGNIAKIPALSRVKWTPSKSRWNFSSTACAWSNAAFAFWMSESSGSFLNKTAVASSTTFSCFSPATENDRAKRSTSGGRGICGKLS
jgi:hypothetical protein